MEVKPIIPIAENGIYKILVPDDDRIVIQIEDANVPEWLQDSMKMGTVPASSQLVSLFQGAMPSVSISCEHIPEVSSFCVELCKKDIQLQKDFVVKKTAEIFKIS